MSEAAQPRVSSLSVTGAITVGTAALMILGIQPILLGALTEDEQEIFLVLFRKIARAGRSQVHQMASSA